MNDPRQILVTFLRPIYSPNCGRYNLLYDLLSPETLHNAKKAIREKLNVCKFTQVIGARVTIQT